jgi:hypothetical protein
MSSAAADSRPSGAGAGQVEGAVRDILDGLDRSLRLVGLFGGGLLILSTALMGTAVLLLVLRPSAAALTRALADVGFKDVEVHATAQQLRGFMGDVRPQTAEVIVRRKHIGWLSNDLGFKRQDDGTFEAIISEYDRNKYSRAWLDQLTQRYACHAARTKLAEQGFDLVTEETARDGRIHLVLRRMV